MQAITKLKKLAAEKGLTVKDCGNGHIQVTGGPLLVNWYPMSKRGTLYVAGVRDSSPHASPEYVIQRALTPPPERAVSTQRKGTYRKRKIAMLKNSNTCHWCKCALSLDGEVPDTVKATLDHVIPLRRGGLDNPNNHVLACEPCNSKRGHAMPEVGEGFAKC